MKFLLSRLLAKLLAMLKEHREVIVRNMARVLWSGGTVALFHLGVNVHTVEYWQLASEPFAAALFWLFGWLASRALQKWAKQKSTAVSRQAVSAATGVPIEDIPDQVHDDAAAYVKIMDKNGGVPSPPVAEIINQPRQQP